MRLLIPCFSTNLVFAQNFEGFLALRVEAKLSKPGTKTPFPATLSAATLVLTDSHLAYKNPVAERKKLDTVGAKRVPQMVTLVTLVNAGYAG